MLGMLGIILSVENFIIQHTDCLNNQTAFPNVMILCNGWFMLKVTESLKGHSSRLECGPMPKVVTALPNIGGAL